MLQTIVIGHLGADAEVKSSNGKDFITFRVADTDRFKDSAGVVHEATTWIDCILPGDRKVKDFLKKGQMVYVMGSVKLRVYSSAKDKCMKAGISINVQQLEFLGKKSDDIPSLLYNQDKSQQFHVGKYFYSPEVHTLYPNATATELFDESGMKYVADAEGYIKKVL